MLLREVALAQIALAEQTARKQMNGRSATSVVAAASKDANSCRCTSFTRTASSARYNEKVLLPAHVEQD
jgi:hypothetical protein